MKFRNQNDREHKNNIIIKTGKFVYNFIRHYRTAACVLYYVYRYTCRVISAFDTIRLGIHLTHHIDQHVCMRYASVLVRVYESCIRE